MFYLVNIYLVIMVEKFKDAANLMYILSSFRKAKLKKDDLEESLVQATSE